MFGAGLRRTPLSIRAEGSYLHASDQGVLRVPTGIWPFVLCQMHGSSLRRTPLSIRAEGSYLHAVFQYAVDCHCALPLMFRDIVLDYLGSVDYKDWSIISMLQYIESKRELHADAIDHIKGDVYTVLQSYEKGGSVCKNAKKRINKILSTYDKSFSAAEISQFKNKLRCKAEAEEHKTALRMKHTSECTVEDLKEFHANRRIVSQLIDGNDNNNKSTERDNIHQRQPGDDDNRKSMEQSDNEKDNEELIRQADSEKNVAEGSGDYNTMDCFAERIEYQPPTSRRRSWTLSSGTDVEE
ncbi:4456_t:CDS:2, partial [Ambispora leptoticha]